MQITNNIHYIKGLSLLEVLIALLVLSIGLLGIAGLQLTGLQENQNAHFRTQAVYLANDMADRMRANPTGDYSIVDNTNRSFNLPNPDCTNDCTPNQLAQRDAYEWLSAASTTSVANLLPKGKGIVSGGNNGIFTISVFWDDDRQGTGTDCSADADPGENLRCLNLEFTL